MRWICPSCNKSTCVGCEPVDTERVDHASIAGHFERELIDARAEIERLRAALTPFAKMADQVDEWSKGTGAFTGQFDANDLRRARELVRHEQSRAADQPETGK